MRFIDAVYALTETLGDATNTFDPETGNDVYTFDNGAVLTVPTQLD